MAESCFSFCRRKRAEANLDISGNQGTRVKIYSHRELRRATGDFSQVNELGKGSFGVVYKAELCDGSTAAVKVLSAESQQGAKEFLTELEVISNVSHENLVRLYGCCIEGKNRMLVYEYLENNSLAKMLLHGDGSTNNLKWQTRRNICLGIARGLAHLHAAKTHIVHRDIKASNILLDGELNAKISDFGLAKFLPPNKTHVSTRVAGTVGYVAPEYAFSGHVARHSDVYSFGVVILEIVCGRSSVDLKLPHEERNLLERAWVLYERNELITIVDAKLGGQFDAEGASLLLKIGLWCTQDGPKSRPHMSKVVKMLEGKVDVDKLNKISRPALVSDFLMPREDLSKGQSSATNTEDSDLYSVPTRTSLTFSTLSARD